MIITSITHYFCCFPCNFLLVLDASGYYDGGIFEGDELRLVDPEQCWRLNIKVKEVFWANQPFYVNDSTVPFQVKPVVGNYHVSVESSVFEVLNQIFFINGKKLRIFN